MSSSDTSRYTPPMGERDKLDRTGEESRRSRSRRRINKTRRHRRSVTRSNRRQSKRETYRKRSRSRLTTTTDTTDSTTPDRTLARKRSMHRSRRRRCLSSTDSSNSCDSSSDSSYPSSKRRRRSRSKIRSDHREKRRRMFSGPNKEREFMDNFVRLMNNKGNPFEGAHNVIPEFDPDTHSQSAADWIRKVNETARIYGWSDKQIVYYAIPKLAGQAKKWYQGRSSVDLSWNQWQKKIIKTFPDDRNYADRLSEMLNRRSKREESLEEYFHEKARLVKMCGITGRNAVDCIVTGNAASNNNNENKSDNTQNVLQITSTEQLNSKYFKSVTLDNVPCSAYIDFGSQCTLVQEKVADSLRLQGTNLPKSKLMGRGIKFDKGERLLSETKQINVNVIDVTNSSQNSSICTDKEPITLEMLNIGPKVTESGIIMLLDLLNNFRDCFALNLRELGFTSITQMTLHLNDNTPVTYRPYRLPFSERAKVREMVGNLLDNGIIQESQSAYASPIVLVRKKNNEYRMCVDYRALNRKTVKDSYPMPVIDDQLDRLSGKSYFTSLDLASGYHQIPVAEESRHLTAFVTPDGHYEYLRMPFGLVNAPAVFQSMINKALGADRFELAIPYLDDLLSTGSTFQEAFSKLERILQLLRKANLTLNLKKCFFFQSHISYLGYEISEKGLKPGEEKIKAVSEFPRPTNVHQIRQFEYNFSIEYRPGHSMQHVDALSRNPVTPPSREEELEVLNITATDWLHTVQMTDPRIKHIKAILETPEVDLKDISDNYSLRDGKVYRRVGSKLKWVVPNSARWRICQLNHDEAGHFSTEKTLEKIRNDYWFPKMNRFVKKYVEACINCAYNKEMSGKKTGYLHPIPKVNAIFHTIHMDHLGPFIKSKKGNTYILGVIDGFSKFIFVRPVRNTRSKTTIKVLEDIFATFGSPKIIISDQGTSFSSSEFKTFISSIGIKHVFNAVATPRANGQIERYNRTILNSLAAMNHGQDEKDWDSNVAKLQWSLNNTVNKSTGKTPAEIVFGQTTNSQSEGILKGALQTEEQISDSDRLEMRKSVQNRIEERQTKMKENFDKTRGPTRIFKEGDLVMIPNNNPDKGKSKKLAPKFRGPFRVSGVLDKDRYEVCSISGHSKRRYKNIYAADHLKPWITMSHPPLESEGSDEDDSESDNSQ
ncbi:unnamed protein product [Plutella xylostella]|uniref:RNA-directed DNA polymerase n=1 Tax=Plutella xylostella TaxID=51655 RepID=A0A8S4G6R9_PLUXY|nr:unnamed protein product [Plutella xylostella]